MGKARMSAVSNAVSEVPPPAPASHEQDEDQYPRVLGWKPIDPEKIWESYYEGLDTLNKLHESPPETKDWDRIEKVSNDLEELRPFVNAHRAPPDPGEKERQPKFFKPPWTDPALDPAYTYAQYCGQ